MIIAGLAGFAVFMSISGARTAVRIAMPVEQVVWVALEDDRLQMGSGRRRSDIDYRTFQKMHVGKDAVLLKLRDASVATAIPAPCSRTTTSRRSAPRSPSSPRPQATTSEAQGRQHDDAGRPGDGSG